MRLALFDIDGTLLREGIAPKLAFARALRETFDTTGPISGFRFAGMTDPQCVAEIMRMAGIAEVTLVDCTAAAKFGIAALLRIGIVARDRGHEH